MAEVLRTVNRTPTNTNVIDNTTSQPASPNNVEVKYSAFLRYILACTSRDSSLGITECNIYDETTYSSTDTPYFVVRSDTENNLTVMHRCLDTDDVASIMAGTWEGDDCVVRWNVAVRKGEIQADTDAKDGAIGQEGHRDDFWGASILYAAAVGVTRVTPSWRVFRPYDKERPM